MRFFLIAASAFAMTCGGIAIAQQAAPANPDPQAVIAGRYEVEPAHTRVQFSVSHLGFTHWSGDLTQARGTLSIDPTKVSTAKVDITLPTASVSTTNTTLDGELRSAQWFDADQFPTIRFVSTRVVPTGARAATITGNLTFHGITKPVMLKATFNAGGVDPLTKKYTIGFDATTLILRSAFGVKTYLPLIGDQTDLRISAAFVRSAG